MKDNNKKKKAKMTATRLVCLILAGLMLVGAISAGIAVVVLA